MERLKVGIAGYGIVGKRRRHFIDLNEHLQVTAVCDQTFQSNGKLEDGIKYYTNYHELLKENLDILFVCMSNDIAAETTIAGLQHGLHVFCEKPPGRDLQDMRKVVACKKNYPQLKLKYGFNHRYHDSISDALRIINSKELGEIINLRGVYGKSKMVNFDQNQWRTKRNLAGGGILLDQGIHMVDLLRLFAGEFTEIYSFISNDFWKYDIEDNAYALMRTADRKVAMLHSSATQWRHRFQLDISLEKGAIILSGILSGSKSYGSEKMTISWTAKNENGDPKEQTTRYNEDNSWRYEIAEFANAILGKGEICHGTVEDALNTMLLVYRIYCADKEWKKQWNLSDSFAPTQIKQVAECPA